MKEFFEKVSRPRFCLLLSLFVLYIAFGCSFFSEYYLKYTLCKLQSIQRGIVIACIICLTPALLLKSIPSLCKRMIDLSCTALALGSGTAAYKLLLQYNILPEADFLRPSIPGNIPVERWHALMQQAEASSCAAVKFTMFGLPESAYTLAMFLFLFVYISCCFRESGSGAK